MPHSAGKLRSIQRSLSLVSSVMRRRLLRILLAFAPSYMALSSRKSAFLLLLDTGLLQLLRFDREHR